MIQQQPLLLTAVGRRAVKRLRQLAARIEGHKEQLLARYPFATEAIAFNNHELDRLLTYELARRERWFVDPTAIS